MYNLGADINGLSQEIIPNLRIFTENWILRLQKADFDDLYTIGSEFASPTRSHTPFPAVSAKNAVSENFDCQILRKFSEKFGTIFAENPLQFQKNRKHLKNLFAKDHQNLQTNKPSFMQSYRDIW